MAAIIEEIRIRNNALGDTADTDWLMDNVLDVVDIEIDFRVEDYTVANNNVIGEGDNVIVAQPSSHQTGVLIQDDLLWFEQSVHIEEWYVGDSLLIANTHGSNDGTYTITEIVDSNTLRLDPALPVAETFRAFSIVGINTPISGLEFRHNLIENSDAAHFNSLVDGSERRARVTGLSNHNTSTHHTMQQLGNKSYQYGDIQVVGNVYGLSKATSLVQAFTIKQTLLIDPIFLSDHIDDIRNGIAPEYFKDGNCLKYVFEILASEDIANPNKKNEGVSGEVQGNTGWLDENYNTKITNYSTDNLLYKNGTTVNTALELTSDETTLEFLVLNTTDTPFSNGNTKMVFNFALLPQPETEYRDDIDATSQLLKTNYIFDRIEGTLGSTSTTPDNLGTDIQVIKDVNFQYLTNSQAKITVTFDMASDVVDRISNLSSRYYELVLSTQNHANNDRSAESDKVALKVAVDEMFIDTSDPTMITLTNTFLEHPYSDIDTEAVTEIDARKEDDILGICKFTLDKNGREADDIYITSAVAQIVASDGTDSFVLDEENRSLTGFKRVNGITFIDGINEDRGFKTPADENRGNIKLFSDTALDAGGIYNYQFQFPFVFRWEDWEELKDADDEFHDTAISNNGLNHNWNRYDTFSGWDVYFKVTINATKNGSPQTYSKSSIMRTHNYLAGTEWDTENLKYYDVASGDAMAQMIQSYANTRVEGSKTFIGITPPVLIDLVIVLKINVYQKGNFKAQYTISSAYDLHAASWWLSTDTSNRTVIDVSASPIFTGKALINADLLPKEEETFKITCRFYDKRAEVLFPAGNGKLKENGVNKAPEQGGFKIKD